MPVRVWLVPHSVEPDPTDRPVVGEQFAQLANHVVVEVGAEIAVVWTAVFPIRGSAGIVVGIVPVQLRVIEKQLDSLAVGLFREHLQRVLPVWRALHDIPVRHFGIEHGEAVVMA